MNTEQIEHERERIETRAGKQGGLTLGDLAQLKDLEYYEKRRASLERLGATPDAIKSPSNAKQIAHIVFAVVLALGLWGLVVGSLMTFIEDPSVSHFCVALFSIAFCGYFALDKTGKMTIEQEKYIVELEQRLHRLEQKTATSDPENIDKAV